MNKRINRLPLIEKEIEKAQTDYPCLDMSMIDDYRSEVETILEIWSAKTREATAKEAHQ